MDRIAFSSCLALRPFRFAIVPLPHLQATWRCALSSSTPRGRGAWDLDQRSSRPPTRKGQSPQHVRYQPQKEYNNGRSNRSTRQVSYDNRSAFRSRSSSNISERERDWKSAPRKYERREPHNARMYDNNEVLDDYNDNHNGSYRASRGYDERRSTTSSTRRGSSYPQNSSYRRQREPEAFPRRYERSNRRNTRYDSEDSFDDGYDEIRDSNFERRGSFENHYDNRKPGRFSNSQPLWRDRARDRDQRGELDVSPGRIKIRQALDSGADDLIYGISPILLALKSGVRQRFVRLFVQKRASNGEDGEAAVVRGGKNGVGPTRKAANTDALEMIMSLAKGFEVPVSMVPKGDLNLLSVNRPHQGVVLQASKRDFEDLKQLPNVEPDSKNEEGRTPCYLVLDEITDPQNVGSLLRSAHFLGADGVIMCKRNSCDLTAVVSKASSGSLEVMNVYGISSMPRFLRSSQDNGWRVVGMACGEGAISSKELALDQPTLIVLGSEGRGLRTLVKQTCDVVVEIEGLGMQHDDVDSLNVSVAGAVALYQLLGK